MSSALGFHDWIVKSKWFHPMLIAAEVFMCYIIIKKVAYTEIDWKAYMQEVKGFIDGERNYMNIYGDTGPLVYPAGFVYVFSFLYWFTNKGVDILRGQYTFAFLYNVSFKVLLSLYRLESSDTSRIPATIPILLMLSKRIHSIYVLRMFNDCVAVACGYLAVLLFTKNKWRWGCFVYSFGVSVKMNMLLYAPGVLLVLLIGTGLKETVICLTVCAALQVVLGYPFLIDFPIEYLTRSFDVKRVFMYKWTVNFKFLSEEIFVGKSLSILLLVLTVAGMICLWLKWITENMAALRAEDDSKASGSILSLIGIAATNDNSRITQHKELVKDEIPKRTLSAHFIITTIFTSNFIGIVFARTLHYQFYVWYFHTLPYLLWHAQILPIWGKILVLLSIEVSFNVYPATAWSSVLLQAAHFVLLISIFLSPAPLIFTSKKKIAEEEPIKSFKND